MFALNCCQSIYLKVDLSYRFIMSTCTEECTGSQNALVRAALNERARVRSHPRNQFLDQSLSAHLTCGCQEEFHKKHSPFTMILQTSAHEPTAKEAARSTDLPCGHANWMTSQNEFDDPIRPQQQKNN